VDVPRGSLNSSPGAVEGVDVWRRYEGVWHALAGAIAVLVGVVVALDSGVSAVRLGIAVGILCALAGWYAIFAIRGLRCQDERAGLVFLSVATVGFGGLLSISMASAILLSAFSPLTFVLLHRWRLRIPLLLAFYLPVAAGILARTGIGVNGVVKVAFLVLLPMVGALLLGAYITGIITQSRRRAGLIEELTQTRAALAHERHEAGVRAERERLAAEIHDTLAQGFTSILMLTRAARAALARDPETADRQLDLVERTARNNLMEARALVNALAPPDLADRGLADALRRLAARHTRDTEVPVHLSVAGEPAAAATPDTDVVLLRAGQEALANVHKHAGASTVHIELSYCDDRTAVTVTDDGRGFEPAAATEGHGLPGIRSRAAAFGGTCTVSSVPGGGTTVCVELP
jgi:signal transduction histidine kinase